MRFIFLMLLAASANIYASDVSKLQVPAGFKVEIFADKVVNARSMTLGEKGTLFVSTRSKGSLYAIEHDGKKAIRMHTLAKRMNTPNGVAFKGGSLYVAEINRILRYDNIENDLANPPKPVVVIDSLPKDRHHGWKFIAFGPDGKLYIPVGAPCNICESPEPYASILRMNADGSDLETVAKGVRNTVGFTWHPTSKQLWFTDNGRDWFGDDLPPCELNVVTEIGQHFGYPFCHGGIYPDNEFTARSCKEFVKPEINFGAHTAPLGLRFYTGTQFPESYRGDLFVALHGSWNRSSKVGYAVLRIPFTDGKPGKPEDFLSGFLNKEDVSGRPVDVLVMPDGALLVSDDFAGKIYRVSYIGETASSKK